MHYDSHIKHLLSLTVIINAIFFYSVDFLRGGCASSIEWQGQTGITILFVWLVFGNP